MRPAALAPVPARVPRRRALAALAALSAALLARPRVAAATVVVPLSRAELVGRSDLIVRATVADQRSEWTADRAQIVTLTRLRVASYLKGAGPAELVLRQFGGAVGDIASRVAGDARFAQGQDVVLFLRRGEGTVVFLTALAQAAYYVQPASPARVRRDLSGLTFAAPAPNGQMTLVEPGAELPEPLDALVRDIARLVAAPAGGAR